MANAAATRRLVEVENVAASGDGSAGNQADFANNLGRHALALSGVHNGRGADATDRLRVYRNNVIVSLSEALATAHPATQRLLGEEFFQNAAVAYAMENKPRSPLMFEYGRDFANFLAALPGVEPYPFVPEAAAIERAMIDATNAADAPPLPADAMAEVPPEALGDVRFRKHPATRLVWCDAGGFGAWLSNQDPPRPAVQAVAALVTRPHVETLIEGLDKPAASFVDALISGQTLGEAASDADDALDLPATLALLMTAGAFEGLQRPG